MVRPKVCKDAAGGKPGGNTATYGKNAGRALVSHHRDQHASHHRVEGPLGPPIRQTASIFKQPVTLVHTTSKEARPAHSVELRNKTGGREEKPKQVFWAKRLDKLRATHPVDGEPEPCALPQRLIPVGPDLGDMVAEASVAAALYAHQAGSHHVAGQNHQKKTIDGNPGVYVEPNQPLIQQVIVAENDIFTQERRVGDARRRLEEAMKHFGGR